MQIIEHAYVKYIRFSLNSLFLFIQTCIAILLKDVSSYILYYTT